MARARNKVRKRRNSRTYDGNPKSEKRQRMAEVLDLPDEEKCGPNGKRKASKAIPAKPTDESKLKPDVGVYAGLTVCPPWRCSLCDVNIPSERLRHVHAEGKKHRANVHALNANAQDAENVGSCSKKRKVRGLGPDISDKSDGKSGSKKRKKDKDVLDKSDDTRANDKHPSGTILQQYQIGKKIDGLGEDIFSCLIYQDVGSLLRKPPPKKAAAKTFTSYEHALEYYQYLQELHTATEIAPEPVGPCQGSNEEEFFVCTEEVSSIDSWLSGKKNLWKKCNNNCYALGDGLKDLFQEITLGLEVTHKMKKRHGNVLRGVGVTKRGKARFINVCARDEGNLDEAIRKDFIGFRNLLEKTVCNNPPSNSKDFKMIKESVPELKQFFALLDWKLNQKDYTIHKWLYRPFIFWKTTRKSVFFNKLAELLNVDKRHFCTAFDIETIPGCPFEGIGVPNNWFTRIDIKKYPKLEESRRIFSERNGEWLNDSFAAPLFIRNDDTHHSKKRLAMETMDFLLPDVLGACYLFLAGTVLQSYKMQNIIRVVDKKFKSKKTVGEYFWTEPSPFLLNNG